MNTKYEIRFWVAGEQSEGWQHARSFTDEAAALERFEELKDNAVVLALQLVKIEAVVTPVEEWKR